MESAMAERREEVRTSDATGDQDTQRVATRVTTPDARRPITLSALLEGKIISVGRRPECQRLNFFFP